MFECTEEDPYCSLTATELVAGSLVRIFSADFENFSDDVLVLCVFIGICVLSWCVTHFVVGFCKRPRLATPARGQSQYRNRPPTRRGNQPDHPEVQFEEADNGQPVDPQNQPAVVDYRATGDGWEPEGEFDPDYDVNNEVIMMMIQDDDDVLEEMSEEGSNSDDEDVLRRIIMADTDEEARSYAINGVDDVTENAVANGVDDVMENSTANGVNDVMENMVPNNTSNENVDEVADPADT
ncbi:uncharacterized protein LOC100175208 [Ciona intestinalis]